MVLLIEAKSELASLVACVLLPLMSGEARPDTLAQGVNLGALSSGVYTVEYQNRDGSVTPLTAFQID